MADIIKFPKSRIEKEDNHADMEALFKILHGKIRKVVIIAELLDGSGFVGTYPNEVDREDSQELYDIVSEVIFDAEPYN